MKCGNCKNFNGCATVNRLIWPCGSYAPLIATNADRIRAMSDEELCDFLAEWNKTPLSWKQDAFGECLYWLQQPAEEDTK